ncbi:hypothetical protein BHE90_010064 [Fusarium euwallaceae]|uniref:Uncharacterized protein n=2 Tax=Fusarium solani species complex TaxID=232080 RepID=A0A3M2S1E6_9HYPO|nr:hypothetical protein CDV36_009301 [Fusarium kuroshium]RTE75477.1 hypothetical protein BHE90_010064 [Fusarium euwallaceae]
MTLPVPRHPRNWDPEGFENSRKRQRRRQIAPLRSEDPPAPEDGPAPTTLQPSRSSRVDMEASTPNGTQHATSVPLEVQGSNINRTGLYTTVILEDEKGVTEAPARVKVVPGSKKPGVTEHFAKEHDLFTVALPENKKRSIPEGLRTNCSTKIKIRHPSDPSEEACRTAYVWSTDPDRELDYDMRLPSDHRRFCESRDEEELPPAQPVDIGGHHFGTINHPEDFNMLLDDQQHVDISNGGHCQLCLDLAMLKGGIYPVYPP